MSVVFYPFCEGCGKELSSTQLPFFCQPCTDERLQEQPSKFESWIPLDSSTLPSLLQPKMSFPVTTQQIKDHRAARKASGMVGCISGKPEPPLDFFGYKDVQSWRPIDPMKPYCFCFDCRDLWDNDATIDLQLIQNGHTAALWTYGDLFPAGFVHPKHTVLPQRSNGGGISMMPDKEGHELSPYTDDTCVETSQPEYKSFEEIPTSLPAPRHRDLLNETPQERLKADLAVLRADLQAEMVTVMDSRRTLAYHDDPYDRVLAETIIGAKEKALWDKIHAIDLLLKN